MRVVWLFIFSFLLFSISSVSSSIVINLNDGTTRTVEALYSTLGISVDFPTRVNITILTTANLNCHGFTALPADSISGHFLIYAKNSFAEYNIYRKCFNYFMDESANGGYMARQAMEAGAAGLLLLRQPREALHTGYRVTGFTKGITIPVMVSSPDVLNFILDNYHSILSFDIPVISSSEERFIESLQNQYRGLNIICCILWPILALLTAYCIYVDLKIYSKMDKATRIIHPTLTKAAPCFSALCGAVLNIVDPGGYKLILLFPAALLVRLNFGFLFVTSCLLMKTWIIAVGDKLKSPRMYRISIIIINSVTILQFITVIVWGFVGSVLQIASIVVGAITTVGCIIGFIYYGHALVKLLSGGNTATFGNLSKKIVFFISVFVIFVFSSLILSFLDVMGRALMELLLQFFLSLALIIIYGVLFLRRTMNSPTNIAMNSKNSKNSKNSNSKNSNSNSKNSSHGSQNSSGNNV